MLDLQRSHWEGRADSLHPEVRGTRSDAPSNCTVIEDVGTSFLTESPQQVGIHGLHMPLGAKAQQVRGWVGLRPGAFHPSSQPSSQLELVASFLPPRQLKRHLLASLLFLLPV